MEMNAEFYASDLGKKISAIIAETSKQLIGRQYDAIPCDNIGTEMDDAWRKALSEMLDHYFNELLPWEPGADSTQIVYETADEITVEAFLRQKNDGVVEDADLVMNFTFDLDGTSKFEGLQY